MGERIQSLVKPSHNCALFCCQFGNHGHGLDSGLFSFRIIKGRYLWEVRFRKCLLFVCKNLQRRDACPDSS